MFNKHLLQINIFSCLLLFTPLLKAETVLVAVASNFTKPMAEIADAFKKDTGHTAKLSFGSSGKIVSQLQNGAPFEMFLSADDAKPAKLEQEGLTVPGSRFTYAMGTLVLWSAKPGYVDDQGQILSKGGFQHIALANPKLAPYGEAAVETMKNLGVQDKLQTLQVQGDNISQTHQFVSTGNAELGFVALSQVISDGKIAEGSAWVVPASLHKPIRQDAVLMKNGEANPAAPALLDYLKSEPAKVIIQKYGYGLAQ